MTNTTAKLEYSKLYDNATSLADEHNQAFAICLIDCNDVTELQVHPFIDLPTLLMIDCVLISIVTVIEPNAITNK